MLDIFDSNLHAPASPPPSSDKSIPQHGLLPLFISGIPMTSWLLTVSSNCGRLANSPSMINHTTAGNERQKRVATTEQAEHATINGSGKGWWRLATRARGRRLAIAAMKEDGRHPVMTRCNDGAPPAEGEGVQLLSLGAAPGHHLQRPCLMLALDGGI